MNPWLDALRALPWLAGLTLLLAATSDAFHRRHPGRGMRAQLAAGGHAVAIDLGLALFALGLLLSAEAWWERVIWAAFLAFYAGSLFYRAKAPSPRAPDEGPNPPSPYKGEGGSEGHSAAVSAPLPYPLPDGQERTMRRGGPACPPTGEGPNPPSPPGGEDWREGHSAAVLAPLPYPLPEGQERTMRRGGPACPPTGEGPNPPSPPRGEGGGEGLRRWAEPVVVTLVAPALWFPTQYPPLTIASLALLGVMWVATSIVRRRFWPAAPWNLALAILIFMAAVGTACSAVWELTFPKVTGLILGLAVYRALIEFAGDRRSLLLALAALVLIALGFSATGLLFGELRADKIPFIAALRVRIPQLDRVLPGTQGGRVSTNQLGGTLLYILPLLIGPLLAWRRPDSVPHREWRVWLGLCGLGGVILLLALLLTQSRGAYMGMAAALACLVGLRWRWGPWVLLVGALGLGFAVWHFWPQIAVQLAHNPSTTGLASPGTLLWRVEVWERSIGYLADVPFTGYGLGTFRAVDTLFYGPGIVASGGSDSVFDVGVPHAHNVFLQMGFDTGIPGLIAYLAILLLSARECWLLARQAPGLYGALGMGALAALVGSHVYGLVDVVALGAKPGVLWWGLLAFIACAARQGLHGRDTRNVTQSSGPGP